MEHKFGINGGILPSDVDNSLKNHPDIEAILITSPTYDGVVSDIRQIAETAHAAGVPLLVDEAHGAHFPFSTYFPESAITSGADLVIQSLHKTLPAMTQTAILHRCSDRVDRDRVVRFMDMYQTSSPSYILMESIDACMERLKYHAKEMFLSYTEMLKEAREKLRSLQVLELITEEISGQNAIYDYDCSKILISTGACSGSEIHSLLRETYHIELEMDSLSYITALTSVGDTREGFDRLCHALLEIDRELLDKVIDKKCLEYPDPCIRMEQTMTISEAMDAETEVCPLMESEGRISAEFAYFYPPGIPVITPGERITGQVIDNVRRCKKRGFHLQGLKDYSNQSILIVRET
jgi:arginine/lysine/ornithine decarboxylase